LDEEGEGIIMSSLSRLEIGLLILVVAVVLTPLGIIILVGSHAPYYPVTGDPVKEILDQKGIVIDKVQDRTWDVPGALGGKVYVVTDADTEQTIILTQNFDSVESRDAAIRTWHTSQPGRGKPAGSLFIKGQQIIVIAKASRPVSAIIGSNLTSTPKK
jgi:hypothetical protein